MKTSQFTFIMIMLCTIAFLLMTNKTAKGIMFTTVILNFFLFIVFILKELKEMEK